MSQKENYKICLIGECLSTGGAEKAMALLSEFFVSKGICVHHVIVIDSISYSYSGEILNLGKLKNNSNGFLNKFKRFQVLKKFLKENQFDYIIDFRVRVSFLQEYLISKWLYNAPTVYTVHSSMINLYFPNSKWKSKLIYEKAYGIVTVSNSIQNSIETEFDLQNIKTIYNPIAVSVIQQLSKENIDIDYQFIIAVGRMKDDVKQFDQLIVSYSKSLLPGKNIKLLLLGDGQQRTELEKTVKDLGLSDKVIFKGFVQNPYQYISKSMFFVLSSKREGLPTVILESLACGIPVVSFNCVSGPSEMIVNKENGLLVEDQNFEKLTQAMNLFLENEDLYLNCKANAGQSVARFSLEKIGDQWLDYLKINVS